MDLLQSLPDRGYPAEYLLARIRGRRSALIKDWTRAASDASLFEPASARQPGAPTERAEPEAGRRVLLREYRWVYGQMNASLRRVFADFFLYSELRTLFICLRRLKDRKAGILDDLLDLSLLSDTVKDVLLLSGDLKTAVKGTEGLFLTRSTVYAGLGEVLEEQGLRGVEQMLTERYLAETAASRIAPLMKTFFSRLVDARNLLSLYKCLRLNLKKLPSPVAGGSVSAERLVQTAKTEDLAAAGALIQETTGVPVERPDPSAVERALYLGMTRWLRRQGREPFGGPPILDYLWRCSIEAMNIRILYYVRDVEGEPASTELIH